MEREDGPVSRPFRRPWPCLLDTFRTCCGAELDGMGKERLERTKRTSRTRFVAFEVSLIGERHRVMARPCGMVGIDPIVAKRRSQRVLLVNNRAPCGQCGSIPEA